MVQCYLALCLQWLGFLLRLQWLHVVHAMRRQLGRRRRRLFLPAQLHGVFGLLLCHVLCPAGLRFLRILGNVRRRYRIRLVHRVVLGIVLGLFPAAVQFEQSHAVQQRHLVFRVCCATRVWLVFLVIAVPARRRVGPERCWCVAVPVVQLGVVYLSMCRLWSNGRDLRHKQQLR